MKLKEFFQSKRKLRATGINDFDNQIQNTLIQLGIYFIFLVITSIVCFSLRDFYMYYFNNMIDNLFLKRVIRTEYGLEIFYQDIITVEDWWFFMETTFLDGLHGPSSSNTSDTQAKSIEDSVLLGPPRLRQLRVRNGTCNVHQVFIRNFRTCYGLFSRLNEEVDNRMISSSYFVSDIVSVPTWGKLTKYTSSGFIESFIQDSREANEKMLKQLKESRWIGRGTRFLAVEFSLYNVNVNLFCIVKLIAEISPTGGVIPWTQLQTYKLFNLWTPFDCFYMFCLFIFYMMIIYYAIEEVTEIMHFKWKYFQSIWNCLDAVVIMIGCCSMIYEIFRYFYLKRLFRKYQENPNKFLNMDIIAFCEFSYTNMMSICVFLVWIKVFKYISFNKTMMQFSSTLSRCAKDLVGFGVMFLIVFVAFAQLGYLLFGTENSDFRTFAISIMTLLRMILGDFDYPKIEEANRILGPIYFLAYIFLVFFILLNMFLAIINDTYSEVKQEITQTKLNFGQYFKERFSRLMQFVLGSRSCFKLKKTDVEIVSQSGNEPEGEEEQEDPVNANIEEQPSVEQSSGGPLIITDNLKDLIPKYFTILDDDDDEREPDDSNNKSPTPTQEEFQNLAERVNRMEVTLDKIIRGIDALIEKLETERHSRLQK